jgi:hypothetical protein
MIRSYQDHALEHSRTQVVIPSLGGIEALYLYISTPKEGIPLAIGDRPFNLAIGNGLGHVKRFS